MTKIKMSLHPSVAEDVELSYIDGENIKLCNLENSLAVLKVNIQIPYSSVIPFLDLHLRKMKTYIYKKTFTEIFIADLLVIARMRNNPYALQQMNG